MNSDTSSDELNVDYLDNNNFSINIDNNDDTKNDTTTDLYLNLVANNDKVKSEEDVLSESENLLSSHSIKSLSSLDSESHSDKYINKANNKKKRSNKHRKKKKSVDSDIFINNTSSSKYSTKRESTKKDKHHNSVRSAVDSIKSSIRNDYYDNTPPKLTQQEIRLKKIDLLRKLSELKTKGFKLSKDYDFSSTIEEMEYEFDLVKGFADKRNGVKLYKNLIVNLASVVEFGNDKYDPFDFQLSGWSQHMNIEVDSYEDVLEELYEKYKGKGNKMSPELKLMLLVGFSASAFHFSKKHLSNVPGLDKVMENNPDMISNIINPPKKDSQFMTEQEINIEKQKAELRKKDKEKKRNSMPGNVQNYINTMNDSPTRIQTTDNAKIDIPSDVNAILNDVSESHPKKKTKNSVAEILAKLHGRSDTNTETQEESSIDNSRIVSDSLSETSSKRKKKIRKHL